MALAVYTPDGQTFQLMGGAPQEVLALPIESQISLGWYTNPALVGNPSAPVQGIIVENGVATVTYSSSGPSLADLQAAQIDSINNQAEALLNSVIAPYPPSEVLTWDQQLAEASAYQSNNAYPTPILSAISASGGIPMAELCASIQAASAAYKATTGAIIGKRQALTAQIQAATSTTALASLTLAFGNITQSPSLSSTQVSSLGTTSIAGLSSTQISSL